MRKEACPGHFGKAELRRVLGRHPERWLGSEGAMVTHTHTHDMGMGMGQNL